MDSPEVSLTSESLLEHAVWLRKLALELVRDPGSADDLAQETWLAFFRARPATDRPLRPWLARVLRNAAMRRIRKRASRLAREKNVARDEQLPSEDELVARAEQQQRLASAVLQLPEPYRRAVLLRYYEGLTPAEIATANELPAATVRTHLHRGLELLRTRLDEEHGGKRHAWMIMLGPLLPAPALDPVSPALSISTGFIAATLVLVLVTVAGWKLWGGEQAVSSLAPSGLVAQVTESELAERDASTAERADDAPIVTAPQNAQRVVQLHDPAGRPLVGFGVRAAGQLLNSDQQGQVSLPASSAQLVPFDDLRLKTEAQNSHAPTQRSAPARAPVPVADRVVLKAGPVFQLELSSAFPVDVERLQARLVSEEPGTAQRIDQLAPVRPVGLGFDRPWVRFAGLPNGASSREVEAATWRIELKDELGFTHGSTRVEYEPSRKGDEPQVVSLELSGTGVVEGHLAGLHQSDGLVVSIALRQAAKDGPVLFRAVPDESADYSIRWVPPGDYELTMHCRLDAPIVRMITVRAGEREVVDLELQPLVAAGPLAGSVSSQSKDYSGQLLVFLSDSEGRLIDVFPTTWHRTEEGELLASFRFESTPPGRLGLDVLSLEDAVTFELTPELLESPNEAVQILLLDELPACDWSFEVTDAETGIAIEEFDLEVRVNEGEPRRFLCEPSRAERDAEIPAEKSWTLIAGDLRWNQFDGAAPLRKLRSDASVTWSIRAENYALARGTEAALVTAGPGGLVAHVRLRRQ